VVTLLLPQIKPAGKTGAEMFSDAKGMSFWALDILCSVGKEQC